MNMRTRLCCAVAKMKLLEKGFPPDMVQTLVESAVAVAVETYGSTVDAILTELRTPDEATISAGIASLTGYMDDDLAPIFAAVIDAIRATP